MVSRILLLLFIVVLGTGCDASHNSPVTLTFTTFTATSTIPATATPAPSGTPLPPPPQPTNSPIEGTTSTQVNVRSEPSTAGNVLGMIPPGTTVDIVGKDPAGNWWQILYPQGADGKGWVTAQYITAADATAVPVVGGPGPNSGAVAILQQQIHVRSGPGTGFSSLGTLHAQDVVSLIGKDSNGTWLQIVFAAGPEGKGWVNAGFVQAQGVENLPIVTEAGQVVGTGTPTGIPPTPTPTLVPAPLDNDSIEAPIVSVTFDPSGTYSLIYSGDVSAPAGDREDWIRFVPFNRQVLVEVSCLSDELRVTLIQEAQLSSTNIQCGDRQVMAVEPSLPALVHIQASIAGSQTYFAYTIKVLSMP